MKLQLKGDFTKHHMVSYSDILYGIYSIDIMGCCTPEHSAQQSQSHSNYHVLLPTLGSNFDTISPDK